ncbi:MAG: HD domain-containing protein [Planctomycetia bacterium]|nr:HD domain-containing protein [Planctomycetia bacterium]
MQDDYRSETLVQDTIHGYVTLTSATGDCHPEERYFERDLIDSAWLQRLRQIRQLQTAWLVYPTAEHSRFQHVLGTMWTASRAWAQWRTSFYRAMSEAGQTDAPSSACVEELLRIAALLHDVGHGPFGHFLDEHFFSRYETSQHERLTHETLGAHIIRTELAPYISGLRRSPSGLFGPGESISADEVAYLITRPQVGRQEADRPLWLKTLRCLFCGLYTVDNIDFVMRDAYMTGFGSNPFDLDRLLHYTFFTPQGLTVHAKGVATVMRFIQIRADLFRAVYYHRATRAIDVELADLFKDSVDLLYPYGNPVESLQEYLRFTDFSLLSDVRNWDRSDDPRKRALATPWREFLERKIKWKLLAEKTIFFAGEQSEESSIFSSPRLFEAALREKLPTQFQETELRFDIARHSLLPETTQTRNFWYDPETEQVAPIGSHKSFAQSAKSFRICRVFGASSEAREAVVKALLRLTQGVVDETTNL